jgi:hypothetical protein
MAILPSQLQGKSQAELIAMLVAQSAASERALSCKVSKEKGALSVYGLGRFPVTLYASQWERLIEFAKTGAITQFIAANEATLSRK